MRKSVLFTPNSIARSLVPKKAISVIGRVKNRIITHPKFLPAYNAAYKILPKLMSEGAEGKVKKGLNLKNLDEYRHSGPECKYLCGHASKTEIRNKPWTKEEIKEYKHRVENSRCPMCEGELKVRIKGEDTEGAFQYDPEQIKMGIKVEMEHTDDEKEAEKIAKDHLREYEFYYSALVPLEDCMKQVKNGAADGIIVLAVKSDALYSIAKLLEYLRKQGSVGHSLSVKADKESFGFDGDGSDKIKALHAFRYSKDGKSH